MRQFRAVGPSPCLLCFAWFVCGGAHIDHVVVIGAVGARDGTLTMMVGGSREAFLRSQPVLQLMGKSVIHCGDLGAGLAAKLANKCVS